MRDNLMPTNSIQAANPIIPRRTLIVVTLVLLLLLVAALSPSSRASLSKKTLRVMTYNIHVGVGMDKKLDLQRIADVIKAEKPDLVGLQEVDRGTRRTEHHDEIAELAGLTKMDYAFAHNLDFDGGQYGVAILSRFLIKNIDHKMYENKREAERRGMLRVEVETSGKTINFVTTHLDYKYADGRLFETEQLLKFLAGVEGPMFVVADLNDEPQGDAYKLLLTRLRDGWIDSGAQGEGLSFPADKPVKRIDYILYRKGEGVKAKKSWTVKTEASDHVPVMTEFEIK